MNVLSLFDGISCGQVALGRAGIEYENYYASEIDKYAIAVARHRYPKTIQLGDICGVQYENGAIFHHQNDDPIKNGGSYITKIDLLIGGSPCQGFSVAGKGQAFNDPRSKLFFEYVRLLKEVKPTYFLLENVRMKKEYLDTITDLLECEPVVINSSLVSAQNRVRYYWTNIPVDQPEDKGVLLKDVLDSCNDGINYTGCAIRGRYNKDGTTSQMLEDNGLEKANSLTTVQKDSLCHMVGYVDIKGHDSIKRVYSQDGKAPTLTTIGGGNREPNVALDKSKWRKLTPLECERHKHYQVK